MRGIVFAVMAIIAAIILVFLTSVAVEPIGDFAKEQTSATAIKGDSTIDSIISVLAKEIPLILAGGFILVGVLYYVQNARPRRRL